MVSRAGLASYEKNLVLLTGLDTSDIYSVVQTLYRLLSAHFWAGSPMVITEVLVGSLSFWRRY